MMTEPDNKQLTPLTQNHWKLIGTVVGIALLFFAALWLVAPDRSFHQDELTNFRMHDLRDRGQNAEPQHRYFHTFYQWWVVRPLDHRQARLPTMVLSTINLLLFSFLCFRIAGAKGAVLGAIVFFFWPRSWDDALEMRYYAFVYTTACLGLHALLSMIRGAAIWPVLLLSTLLLLHRGWHPTALPFHLGTLGIAVIVLVCQATLLTFNWKTKKQGGDQFPYRRVLVPAALCIIMIGGALWLTPKILSSFKVMEVINENLRADNLTWKFSHLFTWLFAWVDDRFANPFILIRTVRVAFLILLGLGAFAAIKEKQWLLLCGLILLIGQVTAALLIEGSWSRMAIGYKYLTSSAIFLMLLLVMGMVACLDLFQRIFTQRGQQYGIASIIILFFLPLLPRTITSAMGDGSHFDAIWKTIGEDNKGSQIPIIFGTSEFTQSAPFYIEMNPEYQGRVIGQHETGIEVVPYLVSRTVPTYIVYPTGKLDELPAKDKYTELATFRSNFSPSWDMTLYRQKPRLDNPEAFAQVRKGAYAQRGPLNLWNRPVKANGGSYWLANNRSIVYDFDPVPDGSWVLGVEVEHDAPQGGGFIIEANGGRIVGDLKLPSNAAPSSMKTSFFRLPNDLNDQKITITLTNLGENSARKRDDSKSRYLKITSIGLYENSGQETVESLIDKMPLAESPPGLIDGAFPINPNTADKLFFSAAPEGFAILPEYQDGNLFLCLPPKLSTQVMQSPIFEVVPNTLIIPELEARAINPERVNFVPFLVFLDDSRNTVDRKDLSQMPIDRRSIDWTRRLSLIPVPEKATKALIMLYVNSPEGFEPPVDSGYEIRTLRITRPQSPTEESDP